MKESPTIILTGGGSGGHITPLLPLARELKQLSPNCQITYIGFKGDKFDSLKQRSAYFDFVSFIDAGKFRRYHGESLLSHLLDVKTLLLNARDLFKVITAVFKAFKILRKVKPDVVFSKGGFVVVPVGIAAHILRIPIITHDSDAAPGLANRIVGRWAIVNATGMPARFYNYPSERVRYVGVPTAADLSSVDASQTAALKKELSLPPGSQVLLVAGGGNGSKKLNDLTLAMAPELLGSNPALVIIHICGQAHETSLKQVYKASLTAPELKRVKVMGFSTDFNKYEMVADVIFSRAGATSLAEFAIAAKACVIMPSPFLAAGHQLKNAEELVASDAAIVVSEETSAGELRAVIGELLNNESRRRQLGRNVARLAKPAAARKLAGLILEIGRKGGR